MKLAILQLLLYILAGALATGVDVHCGPNSYYSSAGPTCPTKFCAGYKQVREVCIQTYAPVAGCFCCDGYYLNCAKQCVPMNECTAADANCI